jgi:flagellar protein FlaJ
MANKERPSYLTTVSYRLFGEKASRFTAFKVIYLKSGISRLYESYVAIMFFFSLSAFVSAFAASALIHHVLFELAPLQFLIAILALSCVIALTVPISFILYPLYRRTQKMKEMDANLVYTTGYMGVLSAGGIGIERIFERVAQVEKHRPIKDLARRIVINAKVFGSDMASSLSEAASRSPSEVFSKILIGITNAFRTSGDLKSLLEFETERLLHAKREELKKTLGTLTVLGEIYISAMVMGPVVFIVMLTILSVMGNVTFGLSPPEQLNLTVFFGLPVISATFIVILNSVLPEEE